uniref:Tumor protein p53-inducible protein 11 n=1 Tax=Hucho hucho TaxID=62062 RepID=A0A4W5L6E7_9TELE
MSSKSQPPLMKKHSQTDLVSRLKTRKILGVGGEDDDGEIHRSKLISVPHTCRHGYSNPATFQLLVQRSNC